MPVHYWFIHFVTDNTCTFLVEELRVLRKIFKNFLETKRVKIAGFINYCPANTLQK